MGERRRQTCHHLFFFFLNSLPFLFQYRSKQLIGTSSSTNVFSLYLIHTLAAFAWICHPPSPAVCTGEYFISVKATFMRQLLASSTGIAVSQWGNTIHLPRISPVRPLWPQMLQGRKSINVSLFV